MKGKKWRRKTLSGRKDDETKVELAGRQINWEYKCLFTRQSEVF